MEKEKLLYDLKRILEYINKSKINDKAEKWKKHFPFSEVDDNLNILLTNENIKLEFERDTKEKYLFSLDLNDKIKSFTFSDWTPQQHKKYIMTQIRCWINQLSNSMLADNIKYREITDNLNKKYGTKYKYVFEFKLRIPPAFITGFGKTIIANSYIIAFNENKNKLISNIFFEYWPNEKKYLIDKFNDNKIVNMNNLYQILFNTSGLVDEFHFKINDGEWHRKYIDSIDGEPKIEKL
jgi:hypothetical protein